MSCPHVRADLIDQFKSLGVASSCLDLIRNQDRRGVADLHRFVDISLDSWPYCGGNTLAESLWYGVPAITLRGGRFSTNYGSSLLAACGLEDLIAYSEDEYVQIATRLAADPARLDRIRKTLRNEMCRPNGFSDTAAFARDFGVALREIRSRANLLNH
jgi:protein O-GlcNAc transferase